MSNDAVSPFLSIVVPVFNVEKYLERCLDSILKQTFTDFELICVDDGSVDSSTSILEKYVRKDNRIKIIKKKNGGLSSARNAGLEIATGEWVLFVDSDDLLGCHGKTNSDELSQLCAHASEDVDWIVAQSTVFYEDGYKHKDESGDLSYFQLPKEGIYHKNQLLNIHMNVCAWGKLYRRSLMGASKNNLGSKCSIPLYFRTGTPVISPTHLASSAFIAARHPVRQLMGGGVRRSRTSGRCI